MRALFRYFHRLRCQTIDWRAYWVKPNLLEGQRKMGELQRPVELEVSTPSSSRDMTGMLRKPSASSRAKREEHGTH